jgi:ATP-binding cassette subfamily C protein CydD
LRNAPIILMDEPTAHLDPDAEQEFLSKLEDLAKGRTLLAATHSETLIAASDAVIRLQSQQMLEDAEC